MRQSLLAAAVLLGLVGLLAGVLPGSRSDPVVNGPVVVVAEVSRV